MKGERVRDVKRKKYRQRQEGIVRDMRTRETN